jgi:hypothetical protein
VLLWLLVFAVVLALFNWGLYRGIRTVEQNQAAEILGEPGDSLLRAEFDRSDSFEGWDRQTGRWELRQGSAVQVDTEAYDTRMLHEAPMSPILIQSTFQLLEGAAAGLIFDSVEGGPRNMQLVRFTEDGNALIWGWIDAVGAFHQEGAALVTPPGAEWQTLEILREEESYAIILNDRLIAQEQPRRLRGPLVGMTTSRSAAAFDWFKLRSVERKLDGTPAALAGTSAEAGPSGAASASVAGAMLNPALRGGQWQQQGSTLIQSDPRPRFFALPTTMLGSTYSATVAVDFPSVAPQSAGEPTVPAGGLLLSLLRPGAPVRDHLVLVTEGGRTLQWGALDEAAAFVVEGEAQLSETTDAVQEITVLASDGRVTILASGDPVEGASWEVEAGGWVGLVAWSGPVRFENFRMGLGRLVP